MGQRDRSESYRAGMQEATDRLRRAGGRATASQLASVTEKDGRLVAGKMTALRTDGVVGYDSLTREYFFK